MTHDQLSVAQTEAFTILRDLMRLKADDPRPQRIINTIKQAAMAILRLKPLSRQGEDRLVRQHQSGEGGRRTQQTVSPQSTESNDPREADPTSHLTNDQFTQLLQHLPDDLHPTTDKRRLRLARYLARFQLGVTPEIKEAILARTQRLIESRQHQRAA